MIPAQLAAALDKRFRGRTGGPEGLAQLAADYAAHGGPEKIADLDDWVRRRAQYLHPAYGVRDQVRERRLQGPQKHGCGAAEIGTAQGFDGRWYARYAYWLSDGGASAPITHSPPHASEAEAIAWAAAQILDRVAGRGGSETAKKWAAKVEAWCRDQRAPQGELAL